MPLVTQPSPGPGSSVRLVRAGRRQVTGSRWVEQQEQKLGGDSALKLETH